MVCTQRTIVGVSVLILLSLSFQPTGHDVHITNFKRYQVLTNADANL